MEYRCRFCDKAGSCRHGRRRSLKGFLQLLNVHRSGSDDDNEGAAAFLTSFRPSFLNGPNNTLRSTDGRKKQELVRWFDTDPSSLMSKYRVLGGASVRPSHSFC